MSSSKVVAQSAFDVLRLGRSSQFIVARLLRVMWHDPQEFAIQYRESELVTGEDDAYRYTYIMGLPKTLQGQRFAMPLLRIALQSPAGAARGQLSFKDLSRLKRFNSEEAIEYGLIIVRPPRIKDDAPLQDET
ncbi:unnamed protein product [Brassica oleracea]|uniref:Uncharacterized protein n=1 Tax=Brassica oleracea TaxID=3712 RepID=A0A3P6BK13_BRAOL|nr:unnamed protein product [Brassica oleracea]